MKNIFLNLSLLFLQSIHANTNIISPNAENAHPAICEIFFTNEAKENIFECTGSLITKKSKFFLATVSHCVSKKIDHYQLRCNRGSFSFMLKIPQTLLNNMAPIFESSSKIIDNSDKLVFIPIPENISIPPSIVPFRYVGKEKFHQFFKFTKPGFVEVKDNVQCKIAGASRYLPVDSIIKEKYFLQTLETGPKQINLKEFSVDYILNHNILNIVQPHIVADYNWEQGYFTKIHLSNFVNPWFYIIKGDSGGPLFCSKKNSDFFLLGVLRSTPRSCQGDCATSISMPQKCQEINFKLSDSFLTKEQNEAYFYTNHLHSDAPVRVGDPCYQTILNEFSHSEEIDLRCEETVLRLANILASNKCKNQLTYWRSGKILSESPCKCKVTVSASTIQCS